MFLTGTDARGGRSRGGGRILLMGVVSLLAWLLLEMMDPLPVVVPSAPMVEAASRMETAVEMAAAYCRTEGVSVPPALDPNGTCLMGPEITPLVTSLGDLEAKRTTTNPAMASLLVHVLGEAGVGAGDVVAVGASGSFPGLLIAVVTAVEALGARPLSILSLGASSYGATRPRLHLLDLHRILEAGGVFSHGPLAVSLGGERDVGGSMAAPLRDSLLAEMAASGMPVIVEPDLQRNVDIRMSLYTAGAVEAGNEGPLAAFVNIGGGWANLGGSSRVLEVEPGLHETLPEQLLPPDPDRDGVLFRMARREIPVIHLLHLRDLVRRYGLPWDPIPLPPVDDIRIVDPRAVPGPVFWGVGTAYFLTLLLIALTGPRKRAGRAVR